MTWWARALLLVVALPLLDCGQPTAEAPVAAPVVEQVAAELTAAPVKSVAISPTSPSIPNGTRLRFTLTATLTDGTTQDVSAMAAWSVKTTSGTGVATIDSTGLLTSKSVGKVQVTGRYSGHQSSTNVTVTPAAVTSIALTPTTPTIAKGTSQQFVAIATYSDATQQDISALADWSVQDVMGTGVADIDEFGKADGLAVGQVEVTAYYNGVEGSTTMSVVARLVLSVTVTPTTPMIAKGSTQQFKAMAMWSDGVNQDVTATATWGAMDVMGTGVATISKSGLATAKAPGTCWISAATGGKSARVLLTVNDSFVVVPSGTTQVLWGVWGASASDVWAVGAQGTLLHWDGMKWTQPTTAAGTTGMNAVWGSGARDVWFGGDDGLLVHWDGSAFSSRTLSPAAGAIYGLWGSGASDVWAVSSLGAYHYDGTSWTQKLPMMVSGLTAIWGSSASDVWFFEDGHVDHYDGTTLTKLALPAAGSIYGMSGTGARDIWAVGDGGNIFHYDGTAWTAMASPTTRTLVGVSAVSATDVLFTGEGGTILRWNGTAFSALSSPTAEDLMSVFRSGGATFITGWNGVLLR